MAGKPEIGKMGEDLACEFLSKKGFEILARNYTTRPLGEIDIICREASGTLVFAEVKTIVESSAGFLPEDHANSGKIKRMKNMAQMFSAKHPELVNEKGWRIDLVAITLPGNAALTYAIDNVIINWYENVS